MAPAEKQPWLVQGWLEGGQVWRTYRVYPDRTRAAGCADHLAREAREHEFPGETVPAQMRVVALSELDPIELHTAIGDLTRSCRTHSVYIKGRGKPARFA